MFLQRLIGNIYSIFMEILLWLIPIIGFLAAGIIFEDEKNNFQIGYAVLGLLVGLIIDVILFGPVIVLFNIRTSLKNIEKK